MNYRKITEHLLGKLNFNETYLFYVMAFKADYNTYISNVLRETLAKLTNSKVDTISRLVNKFQNEGLLTIKQTITATNKRNAYYLKTENYRLISDTLLNIDKKLAGFLIQFKMLCYNDNNNCDYDKVTIADKMNISRTTLDKYLKLAIDCGYLKETKTGWKLTDDKTFIVCSESIIAKIKRIYPSILTDEDLIEGYIHV